VQASSASWNAGGGTVGDTYAVVSSNSASWVANYNTTSTNSASWVANYNTTNTNSARWVAVYASVQANSATWNAGGGTAGDTYAVVSSNSANWQSAYSTISALTLTAFDTPLTATGDFMLITVGGQPRAIRLWEY
jgi:hypothetical protein